MSRRRNNKLFILFIRGASMYRLRRPYGPTGFALQTLAHRLTRSAHISAGLHLRSQQLFVTIFFEREEFLCARLKRFVKMTEHPGYGVDYIVSLRNSQQIPVRQFIVILID